MRKIIWSLLSLPILMLLSQNAAAKCGAGTVIYFKFNSEIYLLLADHNLPHQRDRGWSGFGGYCSGDPVDVTAARETEEETKGFYRRDELLGKLVSSPQIRVGDFTTFFVEVDYVPAIVINNQKPTHQEAAYFERGLYAWIPVSVIWQALAKRRTGAARIPAIYLPPDKRNNQLFEPFVTSLQAAKTAGILPWEQ
jgi:hypothetical protein